jgi:hypothetical protein
MYVVVKTALEAFTGCDASVPPCKSCWKPVTLMRCAGNRYAYHEDQGTYLEAARLGAYLLPAVFSCDVVHPQRALEFALYTPVELWPGRNLFTDAYR